ncbi:type II CRISPR RNA-guided endonuclease Cas9 [Actinomyces sp. HMSC065F11]|uniref:type II CRISPR RNA-guided endonuclease Cas9 n=1 Tax=Actinomyces sp. HMSC065F11 TaxID=1739395 RepID=UPI0008A2472B|nr:type II CRISPR RNA-guided endonuclease Cas9 [Actinomyces sp. HMSC065F11]OFR33291.1 hypothetical protein HMPREF2891_08015 [Actinomyces sp. HMSC065F11]
MATSHLKYRVGVDVGQNSIGFAAIELNDQDLPIRILNSCVLKHDAGIDPEQAKTQTTRLASAGVARRARRRLVRKRKRLEKLDRLITDLGWPLINLEDQSDPYYPWRVRAELVEGFIDDPDERAQKLSVAVRHIVRHRGWRSPWIHERTLLQPAEPSDQYVAFKQRVEDLIGYELPNNLTLGELVVAAGLSPKVNLRRTGPMDKPKNPILGKTLQSDNANELLEIARVQGLDDQTVRKLVLAVFESKSPRGSAAKRVKKDALPGQGAHYRAEKAHPAFQKYRIATVVANLRIKNPNTGEVESIPLEVKNQIVGYLNTWSKRQAPTWIDIADYIGVERQYLRGTASATADGERAAARPPINETHVRILNASKLKPVKDWWKKADEQNRGALVDCLSNSSVIDEEDVKYADALELIGSLDDEQLATLDALKLPIGRAAYSVNSLERLTQRMLVHGDDLHQARKNEFGVDDDWAPPADSIDEPVGNPAVDRVLKAVNRWLLGAEEAWGAPVSVNIEHVRDGFMSKRQAHEIERQNEHRYKQNQAARERLKDSFNVESNRTSDIRRLYALQRQNGECAYCGGAITFQNSEMDHIVPRKGVGSRNTMDNLVAVCSRCNESKTNIPFSVWASSRPFPGVSVEEAVSRVEFWNNDGGIPNADFKKLQQSVKDRLSRTELDPEIDERSMESVAWMARELAHRIRYHFLESGNETKVFVFRGQVTAWARRASGMENRLNFIGGPGKTRLDRRHHAMDAATVALMRNSVAKTLLQRNSLRQQERFSEGTETWKTFRGDPADPGARVIYEKWLEQMRILSELFNEALANDGIPVFSNVRLRLGDGRAHADKVDRLVRHKVGATWSMKDIDRVSTEALWCALTRQPDFVWSKGLPENPQREIVVNGTHFRADDEVEMFPSYSAYLKVRGGAVALGNTIHHARIYRYKAGKKTSYGMVRVFAQDLQRHRHEDLFKAPLKPQSVSMRDAGIKLRTAIQNGEAEYLGWIVVGDEFVVDSSLFSTDKIVEFNKEFPDITRWTLIGLEDNRRINLKPVLLSSEGLPEEVSRNLAEIISVKGWRVPLSQLISAGGLTVVRRDSMGRVRYKSRANFPVTWTIDPEQDV